MRSASCGCGQQQQQCDEAYSGTLSRLKSLQHCNAMLRQKTSLRVVPRNITFRISLQCRRILGGRNLVRVHNVVVAATFDFMTVED